MCYILLYSKLQYYILLAYLMIVLLLYSRAVQTVAPEPN